MRFLSLIILFSSFTPFIYADAPHETYLGKYTGYMQTGGSSIGLGQHEMLIDANQTLHRLAEENSILAWEESAKLEPLSREELLTVVGPDYQDLERVEPFSFSGNFPYLLFFKELNRGGAALILLNDPNDTSKVSFQIYFNEEQMKTGIFDKFNQEAFQGRLPLLNR